MIEFIDVELPLQPHRRGLKLLPQWRVLDFKGG